MTTSNLRFNSLTAYVFAITAITPALAADYTDTTEPLKINGMTGDISESYVNRITDDTVKESLTITNPGGSYTGHNVNITNNYDTANGGAVSAAIKAQAGNNSITLTADEGTWNTITTNGHNATGISIVNSNSSSSISNTKIYNNGFQGTGIYAIILDTPLLLDNVEIHLSDSSGAEDTGAGIWASMSTITNKNADGTINRGVTITSDSSGYAISALVTNYAGIIDLYNSTINVKKVRATEGIICAHYGSSISLTDSSISSTAGNSLIMTLSDADNIVNLSNVNLDNAKGQIIQSVNPQIGDPAPARVTVNLSNGTNFDGYATIVDTQSATNINIATGASWNVTQNSDLGIGTLTLDGASAISFITDNGDFTNINAASVMLASGSILQLDQNADYFEVGDVITLFTGASGDSFTNDNALLMSLDGIALLYRDNDDGTFTIISPDAIPEPATATLGLLALGTLALRRRKTA